MERKLKGPGFKIIRKLAPAYNEIISDKEVSEGLQRLESKKTKREEIPALLNIVARRVYERLYENIVTRNWWLVSRSPRQRYFR